MDEVLPGVLHWTTFHEGIGHGKALLEAFVAGRQRDG